MFAFCAYTSYVHTHECGKHLNNATMPIAGASADSVCVYAVQGTATGTRYSSRGDEEACIISRVRAW